MRGKSRVYSSPSLSTPRCPLAVSKSTWVMPGSTWFMIVNAVARVACPQRSISPPGVNHMSPYLPSRPTAKAVSDRLFSMASLSMMSSDSQLSDTQTAAGLPLKTVSVKASTW